MGPDSPLPRGTLWIAPLPLPWWRRLLNRLSFRRNRIPKGWTEVGLISGDGLRLGELDDSDHKEMP